jgi:hypothetical protein
MSRARGEMTAIAVGRPLQVGAALADGFDVHEQHGGTLRLVVVGGLPKRPAARGAYDPEPASRRRHPDVCWRRR